MLASTGEATTIGTLGSEAGKAAGRAARGAHELRGNQRTSVPLSFLNMGIKVKSGHDFSNLSNLNVMDSKQLPAMRITTYCKYSAVTIRTT